MWALKFAHVTNLKELPVRLNFIKRRYLPQQLLTILTAIPVLPWLRVPFKEQAFRTTPLTPAVTDVFTPLRSHKAKYNCR